MHIYVQEVCICDETENILLMLVSISSWKFHLIVYFTV